MGMSQNFFQRSGVAEIGNWSQLNAPGKKKKKKKKKKRAKPRTRNASPKF